VRVVRDGSFVGIIADREDVAVRAIERARRLATWSAGFRVPALMREAIAADSGQPEIVI
jgi:hypothetical protein